MMHDMIVKPANCAGLKVSDNLARRIVNDTGSESANLPLLAFVLDQLFEKRSDHELSENVYKDFGRRRRGDRRTCQNGGRKNAPGVGWKSS